MTRVSFVLCLLVACGGGGDDDDDDVVDPGPLDGACALDVHVGTFTASLHDGYTAVQGQVFDSVTPFQVSEVIDTAGTCRLMRPPMLFCDPSCEVGFTCDATGTCVAQPKAVSVGTVTVEGMKNPIEMTANPPVYFYSNTGTLDHPGFDEGDPIVLAASGDGDVEPFALGGVGVTALAIEGTTVQLESGATTVATWTAPGSASESEVFAVLNITQHGGTPGWIECDVPDDGQLEIPQSLSDQLLARGISGFPSLDVTRRTADSVMTSAGCVELLVESTAVFDVEIPGVTSCSGDEDCTPPETCQPDLVCG